VEFFESHGSSTNGFTIVSTTDRPINDIKPSVNSWCAIDFRIKEWFPMATKIGLGILRALRFLPSMAQGSASFASAAFGCLLGGHGDGSGFGWKKAIN